ncbi:MAG: general secretion pathway protein GspG [Acidobacteria bacterium]|nr:MAG: general secretion pathway protein GspG [Acidobacteriota bacterium]PYV74006.1 MAG: general secretion pathway protein GspG [Acidobacteriota bacterium]PYV78446.1 MAG: general secretion pathway protein GspG [Acidobacteriota bacterium]
MKVRSKKNRNEGFTLLELIIVMSIMAILVSIAVPNFSAAIRQGREAVLRENLFTLRKVISEYEVDKQKHPQSLDDLKPQYFRDVPIDPMTRHADWTQDQCEQDEIASPDEQDQGGICDVHSSSAQVGTDGIAYNQY